MRVGRNGRRKHRETELAMAWLRLPSAAPRRKAIIARR